MSKPKVYINDDVIGEFYKALADEDEALAAVFGLLFAVLAVLGFFSIFYTENYTF